MTSISVNLSSVSASSASGSGGSKSVDAQIAATQKQIEGLQEKLADLQKQAAENPGSEASKAVLKLAKLIQQQLEMLQARIAQLEALKAQKEQGSGSADASDPAAASKAALSLTTLGNAIDSFVWPRSKCSRADERSVIRHATAIRITASASSALRLLPHQVVGNLEIAYGSSASTSALVLFTRTTSDSSRSAILSAMTREPIRRCRPGRR